MFKKSLKDIVGSRFVVSFFVGFAIVLMYHFVVLPGLSIDNVVINVGSVVFGLMLLMFTYFFIKHQYFTQDEYELFMIDPNKEPETELDYNPDKIKPVNRRIGTRKKQTPKRIGTKTIK